jgi:hypothetical protein
MFFITVALHSMRLASCQTSQSTSRFKERVSLWWGGKKVLTDRLVEEEGFADVFDFGNCAF